MPSDNCFKLNIDDSRSTSSGKIGAGGVIRDHRGSWISSFQINLGINNLSIEYDSVVLVQLFQCANLEMHPLGSLLKGCKNFMYALGTTQINHIFREPNMTVDALAKNSVFHESENPT
ncbi:hypothetical protein ACLB2K_061961 [Fragaria x ananassa]